MSQTKVFQTKNRPIFYNTQFHIPLLKISMKQFDEKTSTRNRKKFELLIFFAFISNFHRNREITSFFIKNIENCITSKIKDFVSSRFPRQYILTKMSKSNHPNNHCNGTTPYNTQKEVDPLKNLEFICPSIQLLNRHHLARDLTQKNVVRPTKGPSINDEKG